MLKYFNPKNWLIFIVYLLLRLVTLLPYSVLMWLGTLLGTVGYYLSHGSRRKIIEINIKLCFPDLSEKEHKAFVKQVMISLVTCPIEMMLAYWGSDRRLKPLGEIQGIEHLQQALRAGHGVLLLSAHLVTFDLGLRLLNMQLDQPVYMLYRAHSNPLIEHWIHAGRIRHCEKTIGKKELGAIFESLKENHAVWYAPDQNFSYHNAFVPFFGIKASTVTGTSRIVRESGAKVVPFFTYRKPNNKGYLIELLPTLENFPSGDDEVDTARIMQIIETAVRKHPEQYLWAHRRFKTRPPGEPRIYPKKKKRR